MTISTNCGCSPSEGACDEHKAQNEAVSEVADVVSEADEVALSKAKWIAAESHRTGKAPAEIVFYHGGTYREQELAVCMIGGMIRNDGEAYEFPLSR